MQLAKGNMWNATRDRAADVYLVTTNNYLRNNGSLVMGRGAASQVTRMWTGIDMEFGGLIEAEAVRQAATGECRNAVKLEYGVLVAPSPYALKGRDVWLGIFQVKYRWWDSADLGLIERSVGVLGKWVEANPGMRVALNFPGIGNGHLKRADVMPMVERLPDAVTVWEL